MPKRVVHSFPVSFEKMRAGDRFESYCGKRFIAELPPSPEEVQAIKEATKDAPECRRCVRIKSKLKGENK